MVVKAYYVDGCKICDCNDKGIPLNIERNCKRCLTANEIKEEKDYIDKLDDIGFIEKRSKSWKWIANTLNVCSPSFFDTRSITKFISFFLKIGLNREVYRRRRCCMYWLDQHFDEITNIFDKHEISIDYNGNMIKVPCPVNNKETASVSQSIKLEAIDNDFAVDSNLANFEFNSFDDNNYDNLFAEETVYPF